MVQTVQAQIVNGTKSSDTIENYSLLVAQSLPPRLHHHCKLPCHKRLAKTGLWSLEDRRTRTDLLGSLQNRLQYLFCQFRHISWTVTLITKSDQIGVNRTKSEISIIKSGHCPQLHHCIRSTFSWIIRILNIRVQNWLNIATHTYDNRNVTSLLLFITLEQTCNVLSTVSSHTYLGITVSSDLKWHEHISNICLKATRTLNFVRHNTYCCSQEAKNLAYLSLVRPNLEYAAAAWDLYTAKDIQQLKRVQRRAARFVKKDYCHTTSVTGLLDELGWLPLFEHRKHSRLTVFYKAFNNLSAISLDHLSVSSRHTKASIPSNENKFMSLPVHTDAFKYSFFPRTITNWNSLPLAVRLSQLIQSSWRSAELSILSLLIIMTLRQ